MKRLGNTIQGHVLDVNKKHLERALQNYDKYLYIHWNPTKKGGVGTWEIRRRPERPVSIFEGFYKGAKIFNICYVESPTLNHVMDVDYLNYQALERIKEMDAWNNKHLLDELEYGSEKLLEKEQHKNREELRYQFRHDKKLISTLREETLSGRNPLNMLMGTYKTYK